MVQVWITFLIITVTWTVIVESSQWQNQSASNDLNPLLFIINPSGSTEVFRKTREVNSTTTTTSSSIVESTTSTTTTSSSSSPTEKPSFVVEDFDAFKSRYKKTYKRQFREFRSKIAFGLNRDLVVKQEKNFKEGRSSFRCATNALSDLSQTEYLLRYVRMTSNRYNSILDGDHLVAAPLLAATADIPDTLDWRKSGFETPPDNQKSCGSCYAYSIARSIEGQVFRRTGRLVDLSVQQMVDCSTTHQNHGCSGGSLRNTLKYLESSGGLMRAEDYPYANQQQRCRFIHQMAVVNVTSWNILPPKDEAALKIACATVGPLAVSINAAPRTFQLYGDGIYDDSTCISETLNHAMLLIGYTEEYWILKNWWGQNWGEGGYMRLKRGSNLCGVSNFAAYAIV